LIGEACSHTTRKTMAPILKTLTDDYANDWGVKIPKSLVKRAEEWDAEIKAVAAETPAKKGK